MDNADKVKLPQLPLYRWLYDGNLTKKLIALLMKFDQSEGEPIEVDDPELQLILQGFDDRIKAVEAVKPEVIQPIPDDKIEEIVNSYL